MLVEILPNNPDSRLIKQAVDLLEDGQILIVPTDTVYALVCDLHNKKALSKMAQMKGKKLSKVNFSILCEDLSHLSEFVKPLDRPTYKLLRHHLPGPFTFILTANNDVPKLFDSKKKEIGLRVPDNGIIKELITTLGHPLAATSLHDEEDTLLDYFVDPYQIYERYDGNNSIGMIIDGGIGHLEASTIVDCTGNEVEIVRQGLGELNL